MKKKTTKYLATVIFLIFSVAFIAKFSGPQILRYYVQTGIGDCGKIPILCMFPSETANTQEINTSYTSELVPYKAFKISAFLPRGFDVVQELVMKTSYKKHKRMFKGNIIYMICQDKDFFPRLYPQLKKQGVNDNYEFIRRTMNAKENEISNITDTFFVIMKGVFIPDLGDQNTSKMIQVNIPGFKGFINYNFDKTGNYFDCNLINTDGLFFKVYIKDRNKILDLDKVFAILSTVRYLDNGIISTQLQPAKLTSVNPAG